MRALAALLPLLLLAPAGAAVADAYEEPACYDIAIVGTVERSEFWTLVNDWDSAFRWYVRVEKVLEGRDVPRRIRVTRIAHADYARYPLKNWLILAAKDDGGYFIRGRAGPVMLDASGAAPKAAVARMAQEAGVARCKGNGDGTPTPDDPSGEDG